MKNLLLKFIEKAGNKAEAELFWKVFHDLPRHKFAVITISYEVLRTQLETVSEQLSWMSRLEIFPILVLRLQKEDYFAYRASQKKAPKGFDHTTLKKHFTLLSRKLMADLRKKRAPVEIVQDAIFWPDTRRSPLSIQTTQILDCLHRGKLPIVSPIGYRDEEEIIVDADILSQALVKKLKPKKYILINTQGGILDDQGQLIPFLNLSHKKEWGVSVNKDFGPQVRDIRNFLKSGPDCAVIITSAENLLKEIFTTKGMGTFIKSFTLYMASSYEDVYPKRIKTLLETAFDKILAKDFFEEDPYRIYYEKNYEGVAIIQEIGEVPYLDKFAVSKLCEGTGLGKSLWIKVIDKFPSLIWRATPENPLNSFYLRECEGCLKYPTWHVYWRGLEEHDIFPTVKQVLEKPKTLFKEADL